MTVQKKVAKRYPPLPKSIPAPAGRVTVEVVELPETVDEIDMGHWHMMDRTIRLRKGMAREQQWRVFYHELSHMALSDSGVANGMSHDLQEAVCDAMATALMQERYG